MDKEKRRVSLGLRGILILFLSLLFFSQLPDSEVLAGEVVISAKEARPTPRVERLREQFFSHKLSICIEKARAMTEIFKKTEGEPIVLRRAKGFMRACETKTVFIQDDELIVGHPGGKPRSSVYSPEASLWLEKEVDTIATRQFEPFQITKDAKKILREEIFPYWKGKTLEEHCYARFSEEMINLENKLVLSLGGRIKNPGGTSTPNYPYLLQKGFKGIKEDAESKLKALDPTDPEDFKKIPFVKSVIIVCDAMKTLAERHAELAKQMAKKESNVKRKKELEEIAKICEWVPYNPPRSFREAIQALWLAQVGLQLEANVPAHGPGRMDQYLYPFYKKDITEEKITKESAQELLDCLWIKFSELRWMSDKGWAEFIGGNIIAQGVNVGGLTADGKDATNEFSYMMLQATMDTRLVQPTVHVLLHKQTPKELLMKVCELIRSGTGHPSIWNMEVLIPVMMAKGATLEDARTTCDQGCIEPLIPGKTHQWGYISFYSSGHALEFALNNGKSRMTGEQLGVKTGDPKSFTSYEEVCEAVKKQIAYQIKFLANHNLIVEQMTAQLTPFPLQSSLIEGCIEKGLSIDEGGATYNFGGGIINYSIADIADSMAAIKKVVFEDKKITIAELCQALDKNFEGHENIQKMLLEAPKYGTDDDYVDLIAREWADFMAQETMKYKNTKGARHNSLLCAMTSNIPLGAVLGAFPSGRKAGEPIADGVCPKQGMDKNGPMAVVKSAAKINYKNQWEGPAFSMHIDPSSLEGDKGLKNLAELIETHFDLGGLHIQFNVVSSETLKAARKHPEQYKGLMLWIGGSYCVYFAELSPKIQEDLINKTVHKF